MSNDRAPRLRRETPPRASVRSDGASSAPELGVGAHEPFHSDDVLVYSGSEFAWPFKVRWMRFFFQSGVEVTNMSDFVAMNSRSRSSPAAMS